MKKDDDLFASDMSKAETKNTFNEKKGTSSILDKIDDSSSSDSVELSGKLKSYKVQKSDTLMLISFKLYGD